MDDENIFLITALSSLPACLCRIRHLAEQAGNDLSRVGSSSLPWVGVITDQRNMRLRKEVLTTPTSN